MQPHTPRPEPGRQGGRPFAAPGVLMVLGLAVAVAIVTAIVWNIPAWRLAGAEIGPRERALLVDEGRARLLRLIALATLFAGFGGLALLGWRANALAMEALRLRREGRFTASFTAALDQLSSDRPEIRLGGIQLLERAAKLPEGGTPTGREAVVTVFGAYVRERAPRRTDRTADPPDAPPAPPTDIQAALTALGRLGPAEGSNLDLAGADLRGAALDGARLEGAYLAGAHLGRALLAGARLIEADLHDADLGGADLSGADLSRANLRGANLACALLVDARLHGANLRSADLTGADLTGADLTDAIGLGRARPGDAGADRG